MFNKISLNFFNTLNNNYHIHKITESKVSQSPHYHDYYQISYVSCGKVLHCQENKEVHLKQGDAFIIPPNFMHSVHFLSPDSEIYSLSFNQDLFNINFSCYNIYKFLIALDPLSTGEKKVNIRLKINLNLVQQTNIKSLLDCILLESTTNNSQYFNPIEIFIPAVLCILFEAYFSDPHNRIRLEEIESYSDSIKHCIKYIDDNFMHTIILQDLTRKFAMSKSTFTLLFSKFTGVSFKYYLNNKRIIQAQTLAQLDDSLSFKEISELVGYDNYSTFYRNFIKFLGITPTEFKIQKKQL